MNTMQIRENIVTRPSADALDQPRIRVNQVGASDLLAMLIAAGTTLGAGHLLAGWPVLDKMLLLSAISFGAAVPWLASTMIGGTARQIGIRIALFVPVLIASFVGGTELLAACFLVQTVAAVQVASELKGRAARTLMLGWSGAAVVLAVLSLVTTA